MTTQQTDSTPTFAEGDRVIVSAGATTSEGMDVYFGGETTGTIVEVNPDNVAVRAPVTGESRWAFPIGDVVTQWVARRCLRHVPAETAPVELSPQEQEMADLKRAYSQATYDLEAFRDKVHRAVIDTARERGWCSDVDDWLARLGLPTRYGDLPRHQGSVILTVGGGLAVRIDGDDTPWRAFYVQDGQIRTGSWHTDDDMARGYQETVYEA